VRSSERAVARLAATQHGLVTRRDAALLGWSSRSIRTWDRSGWIDEPAPGVLRLLAAPPTWEQSIRVATLAAGGHAVASHRCAAALHRLDGSGHDLVEVSLPRSKRLAVPDVVVHRVQALEPRDIVSLHGIPTTGLARTLADLGSVVTADVVERALDDARRRGTSLRWVRETALRLHRPGQAGTRILLDLLNEAAMGGDVRGSWFEKLVEECVRCPDLPPLVRQHRVYDELGRLAGIVDVAFPHLRLGVEAHSRQFHFGRAAEHRDEDRDHRFSRLGWEVLYVGWQSTKAPASLLALVRETARHRAALLQPPEVEP
jgi:predicted transcriptional regulator of viral defense system